jgi:putative flippase GtrA
VIRHFLTRQFARFLVVGGVAAALHWLARFCLSFWLPFSWAVAIAYAVGMAVAFALNSIFVFPQSPKSKATQARNFAVVNLAFFPVVWLVAIGLDLTFRSWGFVHTEGVAHALAIPIPVFATFLLYKFFAFGEHRHGQ